jgi:hypothetical protein
VKIPDEWQRLLFVNWVQSLVTERLGLHSWQGTWEFQIDQVGRKVTLDIKPPAFQVVWTSADQDRPAVKAIIKDAWQRTEAGDLGAGTWFRTRFTSQVGWMSDVYHLHASRLMMEHRRRRASGPFRFTDDALLDFTQNMSEPGPINPPDFTVDVTFRSPGPGPGPFTSKAVSEIATQIRTATAYWTAAFLQKEPDASLTFPAEQHHVDAAQAHLADPAVQYMAADGTSLGPRIYEFAQLGGDAELFQRVMGGLYAYEQSLSQASEYVAIVMLVSAIEALSVPNTPWEGKRKVARFIDFVLTVAPETLDQVIAHRNFSDAFGNRRSQKKFLDEIYNRRSRPLHSGSLQHHVQGFFGNLTEGPMRVALVSGLVRDCIANFLFAPVSMLTGHPQREPQNRRGLESTQWPAMWLGGVAAIKPQRPAIQPGT